MPANISFIDGKAEAAFALKPAWWDASGEYVLDHVPNSEEMLKAAHLDWQVEKQPIYDDDGRRIPGFATTIRSDTGLHLGVMSDSYQVVQNRDAFRFMDDLLRDGIMRYEAAGALRSGRTVWVLARMPGVDTIAEGDNLQRFVLWLNSHDATGSLFAIPTSVRVVCANTATTAIRGQRGIRHVGDMAEKLSQAHDLLSQANERFTDYRDQAQILANRHYSPTDAKQYVSTLVPEPEESGRSSSIRERKVQEIERALQNERQNLPTIKGTWWSLYNAVSEAVDHGRFYGWRGQGRHRAENRMNSVMMGAASDFKQQAFNLAYDMALAS